jgi:hypothetical protein
MFGFFAVLSYSISSLASITFVDGLHITQLERIQLTATCILYMAGAWFTLKEAFKVKNIEFAKDKPKISYIHTGTKRFCYIALYFICTFFSIFTTANMAFEAINRDSSYKLQQSDNYKFDKATKELSISSVQANNTAITSLLKEKEQAVQTQLKQADGWKSWRVSERQKEINRANEIASSYDSKIANLRKSNESIQTKLTAPLPSTVQATSTSSGSSLIDIFGISQKTMMIIVAIAVLILSIGVDLLGAFFTVQYSFQAYMSKNKNKSPTPPPTDKKPIPQSTDSQVKNSGKFTIKKGSLSTAPSMKKSNVLDFPKNTNATACKLHKVSNQAEIRQESGRYKAKKQAGIGQELSNPILKKYINVMYETAENNICIGYKKLAEKVKIKKGDQEVSLTSHQATNIIGHLKHLGIIEVDGNTKILVSKEEALQRIKKGA